MTEGYNERPSRAVFCGMLTISETYQSTEAWHRALATAANNWTQSTPGSGYYTLRTDNEGVDNSPTPPAHDNTPEGVKHRFEGVLDDLTKRRLDEGQARQLGRAAESRVRVGSADQALGKAINKGIV